MSHAACHSPAGHICAVPSGKRCVVPGCGKPAGTRWGPLWCPQHDEARLDRVSRSLEDLTAALEGPVS